MFDAVCWYGCVVFRGVLVIADCFGVVWSEILVSWVFAGLCCLFMVVGCFLVSWA